MLATTEDLELDFFARHFQVNETPEKSQNSRRIAYLFFDSVFTSARSPFKDISYSVKYGWVSWKRYDKYILIITTFHWSQFRIHPVGFYSSGLLWGRIVDAHGPRIPLSCGSMFLLGGYSGIRYFYDSGLPAQAETVPNMAFTLLILCSFLTGCGSGSGLASTVNSTAKSFPDRAVRLYIYMTLNHIYVIHLSVDPQLV